jgi:RNA polymerase sigma factor (sigma-70 family)
MCILYFVVANFIVVQCLHLTLNQVNMINSLIKSNALTQEQRSKINGLMYHSYEKWAIKKAIDFKLLHRFKCQNIAINDLILSSKFGLYKAAQNYNGNSSFPYYSEMHIKNELLKTLTKHFSFSKVPRTFRTKNKTNFTTDELRNYRNLLHPELISYSDYWKFDEFLIGDAEHYDVAYNLIKKEEEQEKIMYIWSVVSEFEPLSKKIFYLRFDSRLNIIRSNKEIARLLGYTRSYVEIILSQCMQNLRDALPI